MLAAPRLLCTAIGCDVMTMIIASVSQQMRMRPQICQPLVVFAMRFQTFRMLSTAFFGRPSQQQQRPDSCLTHAPYGLTRSSHIGSVYAITQLRNFVITVLYSNISQRDFGYVNYHRNSSKLPLFGCWHCKLRCAKGASQRRIPLPKRGTTETHQPTNCPIH